MNEVTYLVMVSVDGNHNKYYKMIPCGNTFTVEYGRVGASPQTRTYPMSVWNKKYIEKIEKGYTDQTSLRSEIVTSLSGEYEEIEDGAVKKLVDTILRYANTFIKSHYKVSSDSVTQSMIDEAQRFINMLSSVDTIHEFNNLLIKIFSVIPRKMNDTQEYIAYDKTDFPKIIEREQDTLDIMASMVERKGNSEFEKKKSHKKNILQTYGLEIRPCNESEMKNIMKKIGEESSDKVKCAFRIENKALEKRFNEYCDMNNISNKDIHFYYHGTKNPNVWNILNTGLVTNPNAPITGKMFGHGIYFAPRAKKSIGYTSLNGSCWAKGSDKTGFLMVFKVAYKNALDVYNYGNYGNFTVNDIERTKNDALYAHKGSMLLNDEVVIYREEQCIPRYIIQLEV